MLPSERMIGFVRRLRREGFAVGPADTRDALSLAAGGEIPRRDRLRQQLRSLMCHDPEEWRRFPELFDAYWSVARAQAQSRGWQARIRAEPAAAGAAATGLAGTADGPAGEGGGAGRQSTLSCADYRFLTSGQQRREIERSAERMARALRWRSPRRRHIATHGRRIDLRKTLRASFKSGGLPLHPRYRVRRALPPRLLLVQDISHSMAPYSALLTRFCRGLLRGVTRCEAFAFHTRLYRVTDIYRVRDPAAARARLEQSNHLWLGGTRIAESLARINDQHARLLDRQTVVVVMSDGFDSDRPEELGRQLAQLRTRARRLLWLNPIMRLQNLRHGDLPAQVRAHIDLLLPAHDLASLAAAIDRMARR